MARYQNQSQGKVVAGRGAIFAPGEIKDGDYQRLADAGLLVRLPDEPAPAPAPKPAPEPEPAPARKERVAPEAVEDLAAHGKTLKDLEKEEPALVPEEKMLKVDPPDNISISNKVEDKPEPERKSSPRAARRKKSSKKRS